MSEITDAIRYEVEIAAWKARVAQQSKIIQEQEKALKKKADEIAELKQGIQPAKDARVAKLEKQIALQIAELKTLRSARCADRKANPPQPTEKKVKGMKILKAWYPETYPA